MRNGLKVCRSVCPAIYVPHGGEMVRPHFSTWHGMRYEIWQIRDIQMIMINIDYPYPADNLYGSLCLDYLKHPQMIAVNGCPHIVWIIHVSCGCTSYPFTP